MKAFCELNTVDFASDKLRKELSEALGKLPDEEKYYISFAYTDYGGDFLDRVFTEYFEKYYPNNTLTENTIYFGKNCIVFGKAAKECYEATEGYLLGFEGIEDFYCEKQIECENESFNMFIDDEFREHSEETKEQIMNLLINEKSGHYSILSSGSVDFCYSELKTFVESNIDLPILEEKQ